MPRVAKAVMKRTDSFPWYEWVEEFEWDDDEFQDNKWVSREADLLEKLITKDEEDEIRIV